MTINWQELFQHGQSISPRFVTLLQQLEAEIGGGGSTPITRARYGSLAPITIAGSGGVNDITWAKVAGTDLLDLTVPALPTIITAGVYAVSVNLSPDTDFSSGGWFRARLALDVSGDLVGVGATSTAGASGNYPIIDLTRTWYLPAGAEIQVTINNYDAAPQDFELNSSSTIQRLS